MTDGQRRVVFPQEIPVDPEKDTRAIFVSLDQGLFASHSMAESFKMLDEDYDHDKLARLRFMASCAVPLRAQGLDLSHVHDQRDADNSELLVVLSPVNDRTMETTPEAIYDFINLDKKSKRAIEKAKPNTWSPPTKLDIDYQFSHAEGMGMPRLQIYAPDLQALTIEERKRVASGDMRPFGRLVVAAIEEASRIKQETYGTGRYDKINFFAAGMVPKALGAIAYMIETNQPYRLGSMTGQNLAIGQSEMVKMLHDYAGRRTYGVASNLPLPANYTRVREPLLRRDIDGHDAELAMMYRQAKAFIHFLVIKGIMSSDQSPHYIEKAMKEGMTVTLANADNEALVEYTNKSLPHGDKQFNYTRIVGVEGKKVGLISNEHSALIAVVSNLGIRNHRERLAS